MATYLLAEDGSFILQENGGLIELEDGNQDTTGLGPDLRAADGEIELRASPDIGQPTVQATEKMVPDIRRTKEI